MIMDRSRKHTEELRARAVKVRIKVIGAGDAGCRSAETLARVFSGLDSGSRPMFRAERAAKNLSFAAVNTDAAGLEKCSLNETLQVGLKLTHGLSAGGDPQVGRVAGQQSSEDLRELVKAVEVVVVLAGLGGGTGTGVAPLICRLARDQGACAVALVEMPFDFEGQKRRLHAQEGYEALRSESDAVVAISKDKLFQTVDGRAGVAEAVRRVTELQAQAVAGLLGLTDGNVVALEFASLKAALKKSRLQTVFGFGIGRGEKMHSQAVESLLAGPMMDKGRHLENADEMIVSVTGGSSTTEEDVREVLAQMGRRVSGRAHVIFSANATESEAKELTVAVFASSGSWRGVSQRFWGRGMTLGEAAPRAVTCAPAGRAWEPVAETATNHESNVTLRPKGTEIRSETPVIRINAGSTGSVETPQSPMRVNSPPPCEVVVSSEAGASVAQVSAEDRGEKIVSPPPRGKPKFEQAQLPLELEETRGRFTQSAPTILNGEDLDIPTYLRRGLKL
jgi:cell division protein FtsZ